MERAHEFKKYTFKTFTWCDVCNKFIWGARKQGYKCKICRMTSHKGSCKEKADTTTTCSQRLYPGSCSSKGSGVDTMNFTKKKVALESIKENIMNSEYLKPYRVETFLALITNLPSPEYLEDVSHYACFVGKIIPEIDSSDQQLSVHLRFSVSDEIMDTMSVLDFWIEKGLSYEERYASLKVLEEISKLEENKKKMLEFGHIDTITKILLPALSRSEILEITIEELKLAQIVFKILFQVTNNKERRLMLVDNDLLDRGISFLKILKKIEGSNLPLFKDKTNRTLLRATRDEGYRCLEGFMLDFYDKDVRVTDYLCSRQVLDLIIDAASRCVVNLAPTIIPQEIKVEKEIYSSVLCTVHSGKWHDKPVAIKVFHPGDLSWNKTNFRKEVTMFTLIKHPNACPFFGYYIADKYDEVDNLDLLQKPLILMPLIENGSLADYINKRSANLRELGLFGLEQVIDTGTLANMAMNAANCIHFLHSRFIIHRDIKPANFLIDENFVVRVTDFGVSRAMETDMTGHYTYIGTEVWMAPEVYTKNYDYKADTYSFALVLWNMITGVSPYMKYEKNINFASIITSGKREEFPTYKQPIHPDLKNLIESCWSTNPQNRPDFSQILDILYNMRCPYTRRYYTHIYDSIDEKTFKDIYIVILTHLDTKSRTSFYLTCKKFYGLLKIANNQSQ